MPSFSKGTYTIYERKETSGDTPMTPESPSNDMAVSRHDTGRTAAFVAVGALAAQSVIGAVRSEIGETTGNEVLQSTVNNAMLGMGYGLIALKGGAIGIAGIGIKGTADEIVRQRNIYRQNVATSFENKLRGRRNNISGGGAYYG